MTWEIFGIIGTIAFAVSGAIVAMEEKYDIFGVYILGFATAFGGGAIRNLLIGYPIHNLWDQKLLFEIALISMTIIFLFPKWLLRPWKKTEMYLDAIGLIAFAIVGANYAVGLNLPVSAVITAAVLTGVGGGILRDLLAQRKPFVLRKEVYALWTIIAGALIGYGIVSSPISLYILFIVLVALRIASVHYNWSLPNKKIHAVPVAEPQKKKISV